MQSDWVSGLLYQRPEYQQIRMFDTGRVLALNPGGGVEWEKSGHVTVPGSHDNRLFVASPDGCGLYLSGNPVKFFQGHNLFGSTDHTGLFFCAGQAARELGLFPQPEVFEHQFLPPRWTRLDLTRSYRFATDAEARAWLRDVAAAARSRHGGAVLTDGTVYWGKGSKRWVMKAYLKSDEIKARGRGHRFSNSLSVIPGALSALTDWASGVVRFELMLRGLELDLLNRQLAPAGLSVDDVPARQVWGWYWDRLTWNRNVEAVEVDVLDASLKPHLRGYLARWRAGEDLRSDLPAPSYYRVRRQLLAACGVDIATPPPPRPGSAPQEAAPVSAELDPARWDPEPIEDYFYRPDPEVSRAYRQPRLL